MNDKALQTTESTAVVFQNNEITVTQEQFELIRNTVARGADDNELRLYFHDCARRGVHPLDKLIYFTAHVSKGERVYTPIVSIDYMRMRAESSGVYAGSDDAAFELKKDWPWTATVTVWKIVQGVRCPFTATARWSEYYPGDAKGFMWKKMRFLMLSKCAEALALRKAFPGQLHGLYAQEEMDQAGTRTIIDAPINEVNEEADAALTEQKPDTNGTCDKCGAECPPGETKCPECMEK